MSITVVDSIMGSGKSTWARKYMNEHPECRWWYVTTYNTEVDKTVELCERINMKAPKEDMIKQGSNKTEHLLRLINEGANIALTHALFLSIQLTPELKEQIESQNYHIIFDEVSNVIEPITATVDDIRAHTLAGTYSIDTTDRKIIWQNYEYKGDADFLLPLTQTGTVYHPREDESALIWAYNHEVFELFNSIYILTYWFIGSRMFHYMLWHGDNFVFCQTDGEQLLTHDEQIMARKEEIQRLIDIEYSNLNDIGGTTGHSRKRLSKNWYAQRRNDESIRQVFLNAYNFLHNKCHAVAGNTLYTTFKSIAENNPLASYKKSFLSCTTTSSNEYSDRKHLAYLVNIFENPAVKNFFADKNIKYNEDIYALNSMIQWIWRSCIRNGEPIRIYIPSIRMRELLEQWFTREE